MFLMAIVEPAPALKHVFVQFSKTTGTDTREIITTATDTNTSTSEREPKEEDGNEGLMAAREKMDEGPRATPEMDTGLTFESALNQKLRLRQKRLKADHHCMFLSRCLEAHVVPKGLHICPEVHYMDGAENHKLNVTLNEIFRDKEKYVCKALIGHYQSIIRETDSQLEDIIRETDSQLADTEWVTPRAQLKPSIASAPNLKSS